MSWALLALAGASLAACLHLLAARGGFWRARDRLDGEPMNRASWPAVVAVVPARNEAEVIGRTMRSLLDQDYPGPFRVVLADDHSRDATAELAREAARASRFGDRLTITSAEPL